MSDANLDLLQSLMSAQTSKDSLMQSALMSLSSCDRVIIFEGSTDYQVYDEWLKNDDTYKHSEHICAKGKSQLIQLYIHAKNINHEDIIKGCKFFVDQDYDMETYNDECITTLDCYSVENYLVNDCVIENILRDEFQLDARKINERSIILKQFQKDLSIFNEFAKDACWPLFIKHNIEGRATFYKKISEIIHIEYGNIHLLNEITETTIHVESESDILRLKDYFYSLSYIRCVRGKYHLEFLKKWLISLRDLINNAGLMSLSKVTKDPAQMEMRRFASATPPPDEIIKFGLLKRG